MAACARGRARLFSHQLPALNCWAHRFPPGWLFSDDPTELCDPDRDLLLFDARPRPRDSGYVLGWHRFKG